MSVREVAYYEVACDHEGCGVTTGDKGDYSAWSDRDGAVEDWEGSEGWVSKDGARAFCEEHRPPSCAECGETEGLIEKQGTGGDLWCAEHVPCEIHVNRRRIGNRWYCMKCNEPIEAVSA